MDWFLYDKDLRHERISFIGIKTQVKKDTILQLFITSEGSKFQGIIFGGMFYEVFCRKPG